MASTRCHSESYRNTKHENPNLMDELKIHVLIQARYRIFDASGKLPFTIDFGLCRHSPHDTDPRNLIIDVSGSALDVPYAIANRLLISHGINTFQRDKERLKHMNLCSSLTEGNRYITLPSPVGRTKHYKDCFTVFEYLVDKDSELASLFLPGREYRINLASKDLGVKWYTYIDEPSIPLNQDILSRPSETAKIVNSKPSAGHASFKVVEGLPWPPAVSTHLHLIPATDTTPCVIEISITNTSTRPLSIETRGRPQLYLQPRDLLGDRTTTRARLYKTLEPDLSLSSFGFSTTDTVAKEEVVDDLPRPGCSGLTSGKLDPRPRGKDLFTLEPGQVILRYVDVGSVLCNCGDGVFNIKLKEQAKWWCVGSVENICDTEDADGGRVRKDLFSRDIPPLILSSDDVVVVKKLEGEIFRI